MDIETIKTILTVAKSENFAEAGREMGYAPSVISKRVMRIERELGVELFVRGHKSSRLEPTTICKTILPDLRVIEDAWGRVRDTATIHSGTGGSGTLRIASLSKPWPTREDEIVAQFMSQNRNINVLLVKESWDPLIQGILQGRYDLAFLAFNDFESPEGAQGGTEELGDRVEFHLVDRVSTMTLAIGSKFPEAALGETTFDSFKDYSIAFNVNAKGKMVENHVTPFLQLAKRYGFVLKAKPMNTRSQSAYLLAKDNKLAIPQPVPYQESEGISFVRLSDWPTEISVYCIAPKGKRSAPAVRMLEYIRKIEAQVLREEAKHRSETARKA